MRYSIVFAALISITSISNVAMAGLENRYIKVENSSGCGATGQPIWFDTSTNFEFSQNGIWVWGLQMEDVDAIRTKVACVNCTLSNNTESNWWFRDPALNVWDDTIDLGGYHSSSGSTNFYRGEEKLELCNDDFDFEEPIMKVKWGYSAPGTQNQWVWRHPPLIIVV